MMNVYTVRIILLFLAFSTAITTVVVGCDNLGKILMPPRNIITVRDQLIQFTCVVQGNLHNDIQLPASFYDVFLPSDEYIRVAGNDSRHPNFKIAFYQLPMSNATDTGYSCKYVLQLTIESAPLEYNGTIVGCKQLASNGSSWEMNATLSVLDVPQLTDNTNTEECVTVNTDVSVRCYFNATTMEGATIVLWSKDDTILTNQDHYEIKSGPAQGMNNVVESTLMIRNFTNSDRGIYNCSSYYNNSLVTSNETVNSGNKSTTLYTECTTHNESEIGQWIGVSVGSLFLGIGVILSFIVLVWCIHKQYKSKKQYSTLPQGHRNDIGTSDGGHSTSAPIVHTDAHDENSKLSESLVKRSSYDSVSDCKQPEQTKTHSVTVEFHTQHQQPLLEVLSTDRPVESEQDVPRMPMPAIAIPSVKGVKTKVPGDDDKILNSIAPYLTNLVCMATLLPYLLQHQLLTRDQEHYLGSQLHSESNKAQNLLNYLKFKGTGSLQELLCSLNLACEHKGHKEIADKLKQEMQANNIDCDDFCCKCK